MKPSKAIQKLGELLALAGGVGIVLMMLHVVGDVAMSKFFNDPLDGTSEIVAAYYMVGVVFLPLAFVTLSGGHLVAELFTSRMEGRALQILILCTRVLSMAYLLFLIVYTFQEAVTRTGEGEAWETSVDLVPVWPSRWLLPMGLAVMALCICMLLIRQVRSGHPDGEHEDLQEGV